MALDQTEKAQAQFVKAWEADNDLKLSSSEFPPGFIASYEQASSGRKHGGRRSRLPLVLGGGAIAAGGVAVGVSRGGGKESVPDSGAVAPGPASPSTAVTLMHVRGGNSFEVEYVSAQPPPGSTVSGYATVSSFSAAFSVQLVVRNPSSIDATRCHAWMILQRDGGQCLQVMTAAPFDLVAGGATQVTVGSLDTAFGAVYDCTPPVEIRTMVATTKCATGPEADWGFSGWYGGAQVTWSISYRILP
jgi:hypothetical protein